MLYLWIFGDNVEDRFGHLKFIIFYLLCGLAATFAQLAFSTGSSVPNLGASGAIAGVLGAYLILFPQGKVKLLTGNRGDSNARTGGHWALDRAAIFQAASAPFLAQQIRAAWPTWRTSGDFWQGLC